MFFGFHLFIYLFIGYYKIFLHNKVNMFKSHFRYMWFILFVAIYSILVMSAYYKNIYDFSFLHILSYMIFDIKTLPNFLCAFSLIVFFSHLNIKKNDIVNSLSRSALAVYIIHQMPCFYPILWKDICIYEEYITSSYFGIYTAIVCLSIYLVCICIDYFRIKFVEQRMLTSFVCMYICKLCDKYKVNEIMNRGAVN